MTDSTALGDHLFREHDEEELSDALATALGELGQLRAVSAAACGFADELGTWCSPDGVSAQSVAAALRERLDNAKGK